MKKFKKSVILIGIVFFHSCQISAFFGTRDIGDLGRAIMREIKNTHTSAIIAGAVSLACLGGPENRNEIAKNIQLYFFPPKVACTKHSELSLQPGITNSNLLPEEIEDILDKENLSGNGHKFMLLVGETRTGKSLLAKQMAYNQGADYYEVPQSALDGYSIKSVLNWLDSLMYRIHKQTEPGKKALLNLDEFGKQLGTSGNQITDAENSEFLNSFKDNFGKIAAKYPNLLTMGTTNFGSADEPGTYNPAIAARINIVRTGKPTYAARENFLQSGCKGHLEKNGIVHADNSTTNHTKTHYNQENDINKPLRENFHVTNTMIQAAAQKRTEDIKKLEKPWTLGTYLRPWLWIKTWQDNAEAQQLKKSILLTPVVTYVINPTDEQIDDYMQATNNVKNYTPLIEDTEEARRNKLSQIEQMKIRNENTSSENPYEIDSSTRTCTVIHQDGDYNEATKKYINAPKTIAYNYGNVNASHIVLEAQRRKNKETIQLNAVSPEAAQRTKIESAQALIPTRDFVGLIRKLTLKNPDQVLHRPKSEILSRKSAYLQSEEFQQEIEKIKIRKALDNAQFKAENQMDNSKNTIKEFKAFKAKEKEKETAANKIQRITRGNLARKKAFADQIKQAKEVTTTK